MTTTPPGSRPQAAPPQTSTPEDPVSARLAGLLNGLTAAPGAGSAAAPAGAPQPGTAQGDDRPEGSGPVGQGDYVVKQGDCISSIAKETGHFWETIWNEGANAELKSVRKNPNVLLPGDRVTVPEKQTKLEQGATEMRHRFKRKGEPAKLRMQLLVEGKPIAGAAFQLTVEGNIVEGITSADGWIDIPIPGDAQRGKLTVNWNGTRLSYSLKLGSIDPVEELRGIQQRLHNLGYACERAGKSLGPLTKAAIKRFRRNNSLPDALSNLDAAVRDKLKEKHGC
jgi:N-acetylmuramoyl-L-alanine amidase